MKEKLKNITPYNGLYDYWKTEVNLLTKKDETFDVMDLDDTLFSVKERIESDEIFKLNRWEKWNLLIANQIGIKNIIHKYYTNKVYHKGIINSVTKHKSLILTAGLREYQEEKVRAMWISDYSMLVTTNAEEKIIALIRYVIFNLKYIPSTIVVFEDRPQYFIEYRDLIEDVLWVKLIINKVVMDWNDSVPNIEEI